MCLGMHLARLETRALLNRVLDRLPDLALDPGNTDPHIRGDVFRSPTSLPVQLPRRGLRQSATRAGQLRGTSFQASSLSVRTSPGRPSTRSPKMLRMTSEVPPSMELARTRRNSLCTSGEPMPTRSGRTMG